MVKKPSLLVIHFCIIATTLAFRNNMQPSELCSTSFSTGNLVELATVKFALVGIHLIDADSAVADEVRECFNSLVEKQLQWPDWSLTFPDSLLRKGTTYTVKDAKVWAIAAGKSIFGDKEYDETYVDEKLREWLYRHPGRLLWFTDGKNIAGDAIDPHSVGAPSLYEILGLYGRNLREGEPVVLYSVNAENLYKPTIADAGAAFYWRRYQDNADAFGFTIGLKDGKESVREWVCSVSEDKPVLKEFHVLRLNKDIDTTDSKLPGDYWDQQRAYIESRRDKK